MDEIRSGLSQVECDVLVIGGGTAGPMAAIRARKRDPKANVILLGFRPAFWPTLFTLPALLVLLGLGTWQVQRLVWKTNLIRAMEERIAAPAVDLPSGAIDAAADVDEIGVVHRGHAGPGVEILDHVEARELRAQIGEEAVVGARQALAVRASVRRFP